MEGDAFGMRVATAALKLALGTAVYIGIVLVAASYPFAAGMMLTFPTLNGLTLALAGREKLAETARLMLPMPVLNCVLCAGYLYAVRIGPAEPFFPSALLVAAAAVWLTAVLALGNGRIRIPVGRELAYAWACTFVLVAVAVLVFSSANVSFGGVTDWPRFWQHNGTRITLFAAGLGVVIAATDFFGSSARWLAPLGSLPVVPFFGVWTVASDIGLQGRLEVLHAMGSSVWLGAAVAIWFVTLFSRCLLQRQERGTEPAWQAKIALAVAGWTACLVVIAALSFALQRL